MGLLDLLPTSQLGLKGLRPPFNIIPNPPGSHHNTYSVDGNPNITLQGINKNIGVPQPSTLDEADSSNQNKLRSKIGQRYMDNPPK